jgi:iron(III) transport system ATP-binding protein
MEQRAANSLTPPVQFVPTAQALPGRTPPVFAGNIGFEDICFSAGETEILRNITFSLQAGEIACLLGPSGCGKTTLLRIAAGITAQTTGKVLLDGAEIAGPNAFLPPEKRNIGLMFQDYALFPHLTVIENIAFGLYALTKSEAIKTAEQALQRVGLLHHRNSYPHILSGGEQQRVALARAIVPRPQVMLMDEPFSGLDQRLRETVRSETLGLMREARATTILVTHDPVEAFELADRIILMRAGAISQIGTPDELYRHPVDIHAARFFSAANEFETIVKGQSVHTPLGTFGAKTYADGARVTVLFRPNAIVPSVLKLGTPGTVLAVRNIGTALSCRVGFAGSESPMLVRLPVTANVRSGDELAFSYAEEDVLVFKSGAGDPS